MVLSHPHRSRKLSTIVFSVVTTIALVAPVTLAQTTDTTTPPPKHKKKKKPATTAPPADSSGGGSDSSSSSSSSSSGSPASSEATPSAEHESTPTAKPDAAESGKSPEAGAATAVPNNTPDIAAWDISDTHEEATRTYLFVGARYRGTIVPQFIENLFIDEGGTFYSNSFGIELDIRKNNGSTIPWIQYVDYNTGDTLFHQKNQPTDDAAFYSVVNSSLKAIYIGVDELWSVPIAQNKLDFEYGFGVGVGYVFGDLGNNWVHQDPNGAFVANNGLRMTPCQKGDTQRGCNVSDHSGATTAKVGGYVEPNWFQGGSVPTIFPHIALPQFSLRYKPIKQFESRLSLGFSLTGFWFGLSANYGLEQRPQPEHKSARRSEQRDTL